MKRVIKVLMMLLCSFVFFSCGSKNAADEENTSKLSTFEFGISTPEEQGIDSKGLTLTDERIQENYPNVYSLLVLRHDQLVYEKYYQGMTEIDMNPVYSVTKSVMSALTGIALEQKLITGIDEKVSDYLPQYFSEVEDERKSNISIKDVLTMTGGLESIDNNYRDYFSSKDWLEYAISKPLVTNPGEVFAYNTGLTHFLSGIITETSKMNTKEYAQKFLFNPLGIVPKWDKDQKGHYGGGTGLYLKPKDMAKLGNLYLHQGAFDSIQVLQKEWVEASILNQVSVDGETGYGYLFWNWESKAIVDGKTYYAYAASGAGGQYIVVVPQLDLVVVITANLNKTSKDNANTVDLIWDYVIPSIMK